MSVFQKRVGQRFSKCCVMSVSLSSTFARLTLISDVKCCTLLESSRRRFLSANLAHKAESGLNVFEPISFSTITRLDPNCETLCRGTIEFREEYESAQTSFHRQIRPICHVYGGRGKIWAAPCGVCAGTWIGCLSHQLHRQVPSGIRHGMCLRSFVIPPFLTEAHVEFHIVIH